MSDKTGLTWLVPTPCPQCGQITVIGYLLVDEKGEHQHTRYICTFWQSGQCGWSGWFVPDPEREQRPATREGQRGAVAVSGAIGTPTRPTMED